MEKGLHWALTVLLTVLKVLPEQAIISGFRGKVDFYVHCGTPCARKWPRSPGKSRSPAVEAQWPIFSDAAKLWNELSAEVQAAYNKLAESTALTGRDIFAKSYITGLYRYPH